MEDYKPPFTITNEILAYVFSISEKLGCIASISNLELKPHLRKNNRINSISFVHFYRLVPEMEEPIFQHIYFKLRFYELYFQTCFSVLYLKKELDKLEFLEDMI